MRFPRFVPLYVFVTLSTLQLLAQSPDGNINGLVSDPSSAAVVGAEVVAVNDVTGVPYTTRTNAEGIYVLSSLPPGPYRLQVSKAGFKTIIKPDIVLNVQDALSINFALPIGAAYEVLTVQGGAPLVNTENASVSTVVDQTYVKNMPLNGRSFQDLILLTPGIVTQTPQQSGALGAGLGRSGEFSVNGQRTESNYYTVDGVSANVGAIAGQNMAFGAGASGSVAAATAMGTTQAIVSVDDLQEFRVQSSSYSAEYGRNPGGQFVFETKSGTNQWHGTAYDYLRNGFVDAQDWFNDYLQVPQPAIRQNDFGGTLGGPLSIPHLYNGREKTFFFISYEGLRLTSPQPASVSIVPDSTLRSAAPAPLNQAMKAFPIPNGPEILVPCNPASDPTCPTSGLKQDGLAEFIGAWSSPSSLDSTSLRFDHTMVDKLRVFFRFSNTTSNSSNRGPGGASPSENHTSAYTFRTYTAGVNLMFSKNFSSELRFNYSSNAATDDSVIDSFGGATPVDLPGLVGLGPGSYELVSLIYDGYSPFLEHSKSAGEQKQYNLVDTVTLSLGRHLLKLGFDYRRLAPFASAPSPNMQYYYLDEPSVEANTGFSDLSTLAPAYPLYANLSVFASDQWKVSTRLNLSLGLRWELNPAPSVTRGIKPYTIQGAGPANWALAPEGTPLWRTTGYNFAPRVGAAYVLRSTLGRELVLRAGGGLFFDTAQQLGSLGFTGPGFGADAGFLPGSFPLLPASGIPVITNPPQPPLSGNFYVFSPHLQLPYTMQWNASVEQALGRSQALTVSYVGAHGARLLLESFLQTPTNPIIGPFGQFVVVKNGLTSDYHSVQTQFRRRLSQGLTGLFSYTLSHCIDYGSQDIQLAAYQRGNCDFDVRQNLSSAFSYDLPNVGKSRFLNSTLHHWGLDNRFTVRSSFPVTLSGDRVVDTATGQWFYTGLNSVPGQPTYISGAQCTAAYNNGLKCPGGRAVNPNGFTLLPGCNQFSCPPGTGAGDVPRNSVRGFGAWQMDLAIRREFTIYEGLKLVFRAEAFNLLNHPNFGAINTNFGETTFGQATATLANSLGILSPLYQMGGPRSMQFALRVAF